MSKKKLLSRSMAAVAAVAVLGTALPANAAELDWGADKNGIITLNTGTVGVTIDQDKTTPDKSTEYKSPAQFDGTITPDNMKRLVFALSIGKSITDGTYDANVAKIVAPGSSEKDAKNTTAVTVAKVVDSIINGGQPDGDIVKNMDAAIATLPADFAKGSTIMIASPADEAYQRLVSIKDGNIPSLKDIAAVTNPGSADGKIELRTSAGLNHNAVKKDNTITDIVNYKNLVPGKTYTIHGEAISINGNENGVNVGEATFIPTEKDGNVTVNIQLKETFKEGMVVFETLKDDQGKVVAEHKDKNDTAQQIGVNTKSASIRTSAFANTGDYIQTGTLISDTVSYEGLVPGKEYRLESRLMCQKDAADTGAKAEHTFTPEKAEGATTVKDIAVTDPDCNTQVVFEKLYDAATGQVVATHEDINDKAQTVGSGELMKKKKKNPTSPAPTKAAPAPAPAPAKEQPRQVINDVPSGAQSGIGSSIFTR